MIIMDYGRKVKIIDQNVDPYKIVYNYNTGWVLKATLISEEENNKIPETKIAGKKVQEEEAQKIKAQEAKSKSIKSTKSQG